MAYKLIGILNITPDSFSDGGLYIAPKRALERAKEMFADGADIVDVGAESTNPNKTELPLTSDQELARLMPVLRELIPAYPGKISVDSYHPETIEAIARELGAAFIANDVTCMNNPEMQRVVTQFGLLSFVSHLPAEFGTDIQAAHKNATLDDAEVVLSELLTRRQELVDRGLDPAKIVLDPGIGFGKTMQLNWELLKFAKLVHADHPDIPVMIGPSRKRYLATDPKTGQLINGWDAQKDKAAIMAYRMSSEANVQAVQIAIKSGANYLRMHDPRIIRDLMA